MSVLDQIKRHGVFHARATYDFDAFGWDFPKCTETRKGVYAFISVEGDILKIGKADGQGVGIKRRVNEYRDMTGRHLKGPSTSASFIKRVQQTARIAEMDVYYIPIDPVPCTIAGVQLMASPARELEHALCGLARAEGHSLRFSRNR